MIIKSVNIVLLIVILVYAFMLVSQRYTARLEYNRLATLQRVAEGLNKDYTKLQIEAGTYSSGLVLQDIAYNKLGLVVPDSKHIVEIK